MVERGTGICMLAALVLLGPAPAAQVATSVRPGASEARLAPPLRRGDVVVLVLDDVAWTDVDTIPTPTLDRLMAAGTSWRRFTTLPVCSPTRYALYFGRWPRRDGILDILESANGSARLEPAPDPTLPTLGDLFQGRGYLTGFFGKWHTGLVFYGPTGTADPYLPPLFLGFDTWRAGTTGNVGSFFEWDRLDDGNITPGILEYVDDVQVEEINAWFAGTRSSGRPRFAVAGFHLAHLPVHAPPAHLLPPGLPPAQTPREGYEIMVRALDRLLDTILRFDDDDPDGEIDVRDTLVVVLGDNGTPESVAPPGLAGRVKGTTFQGGVVCPLIVSGPGFSAGRVETEALASPVDLFATFATWLGSRLLAGVAEDSLPLQTGARDWVLTERVDGQGTDDLALVQGTWKLRRVDDEEVLYDLASDPLENVPLDPKDPAFATVVAGLRAVEAGLPPRL